VSRWWHRVVLRHAVMVRVAGVPLVRLAGAAPVLAYWKCECGRVWR
jgi:hypothetical protein